MKILSTIELLETLYQITGSTIGGVTLVTVPKMNKTNNPHFGNILKIASYSIRLNFMYDESIERRLIKEGKSIEDFKKGTSWHEPVLLDGRITPVCKHKTEDSFYLRVENINQLDCKYIEVSSGVEIAESNLEQWMPKTKPYSNQGLDKPLSFLTPKIVSVHSIRIKGEEYLHSYYVDADISSKPCKLSNNLVALVS